MNAPHPAFTPLLLDTDFLDTWLRDPLQAIPGPDPAAHRRAQMNHLLAARDRIVALMPPDGPDDALEASTRQLELAGHATRRWLSLLKRVRFHHRHRVARRPYGTQSPGALPFRDADHGPLPIVEVLDRAAAFADVEPFTCHRVSHRTRAATSTRHLVPRRLTAADLRSPSEQALIGQWGLFARTHIPAGTCLGVYGGQLLDDVDVFLLQDDRYLMSVSDTVGDVAVNGENLLSLMNTLFEVDETGAITGQPPSGYNVVGEPFQVLLRHGWRARIQAFRASEDIPAGTELRWNYDLSAPSC